MTIEMTEAKKPKIIKANYILQSKVGSGPLDEEVVRRSQEVMDNNNVDFSPLAMDFLKQLQEAIATVKTGKFNTKEAMQAMTEPVMQLKANAATFRYTLLGNLANVMLSFLEAVKELDEDVVRIVEAHHKTLSAIVIKKMQGDGGQAGKLMEDELRAACKRYFSKKA